MKLVKLTLADNDPTWINPEHVVEVNKQGTGTCIHLSTGRLVAVRNSPELVVDMLREDEQ